MKTARWPWPSESSGRIIPKLLSKDQTEELGNIIAHPQPIFDDAGNLTGALNVLIDITERKEAEMALRTSEGKFRTLADSLPQFI